MGKKPESILQGKMQEAAQMMGAFVIKVHGGPYQKAGIPDLNMCYKGRYIGLEVKTPDNPTGPTLIQEHRMKQIREAGGIAQEVRTVEQVKNILKNISEMY